jgi:hypothetical protein
LKYLRIEFSGELGVNDIDHSDSNARGSRSIDWFVSYLPSASNMITVIKSMKMLGGHVCEMRNAYKIVVENQG